MLRVVILGCGLLLAGCLALTRGDLALSPQEIGARQIPVTQEQFNRDTTPALGRRYALYTDSVHQHAIYFDDDGHLVAAKRRLGEDTWKSQRNSIRTAPAEIDMLALTVDGDGRLHVVWNTRDATLQYAISSESGSLELNQGRGMTATEQHITAPHLLRQLNGDLLFIYEDSDNRLTVDHYHTNDRVWSRRHTGLITPAQGDLEWDIYQQKNGALHLAWRHTGGTEAGSRLFYARSDDDGIHWRRSGGEAYTSPLHSNMAEVAWTLAEHSSFSGPLQIVADPNGVPYIGMYRSAEPETSQLFSVAYLNEQTWKVFSGPHNLPDAQQATLRLLAESKDGKTKVHLLYPDPSASQRVAVASTENFSEPHWDIRYLTDEGITGWVPEVDVPLWQRMRQAQVLITRADRPGLDVLIWSPDWEHHLRQYAAGDISKTSTRKIATDKDLLAPDTILDYAERVAQWQWANMPDPKGWHFEPRAWGVCPLYIGTLDIAPYLEDGGFDGNSFHRMMREHAERLNYSLRDEAPYDADDYCVTQAYLRLHKKHQASKMIAESKVLFDKILADPSTHSLDWGNPHSRDRWSWSDALYMGPMSWLMMWEATGNDKYLEFMNQEWWATTERLYSPHIGLFFRDESYLDIREKNGKTIHWARGTSWSFAGLAQVIERFPKTHPDYPRYIEQYRQMAAAFIAAQQDDGLWRPGLLDPGTHNARETSGTSFIAFGLAKGINLGVLEEQPYLDAVQKAWRALTASVGENGKLRNVQPVGAGPHGFDPDNAEAFASGAFLQLAAELYYMQAGLGEKAFRLENPDHELSPHTGMTREHWQDAARYLLEGAFQYVDNKEDSLLFPKQPGKSYPRDGVHNPTSRLEELARTLLTAAPLLREQPDLEINGIRLANYYQHHLARLVDPDSEAFIPPQPKGKGPSQNLVEFGALAMSFFVAPEVLWDPLSQRDRDSLAKTMLSYGEGPTVPSNWKFFNIFVLSFLDSRGYDVDRSILKDYLNKSLSDYRGEGWYNDNPAYDYYSMWGYQFYGMLWSEFYGKRVYPDIAQRFTDHFGEMADSYPYLFSKDGEMIMWGRSIAYRFGSVAPLALLDYTNRADINAGWMRRIASGTLLQFLKHPDFLKDGVPTLGFYGPFEPAVQTYSTRGSVYWSGKAFFALLLPKESPFWSAVENEGPWGNRYTQDAVYNRFHKDSDILITNYPAIGGSEIRAWCHVKVVDNWEAFRGSENYNRLSYHSEFPWQQDGANGAVAMNYVVKNAASEWEAFRLFTFKNYKNGIYYRDAVLETDSRIKFQLAEIPLTNGILRVDRNISPIQTEFRLGHYALPDLGQGIVHNASVVNGREVHTIDNGIHQLAVIPLKGWNSIETLQVHAMHPQSDSSAVINVSAEEKAVAHGTHITLMLWKRSGEGWSEDELNPVEAINFTGSSKNSNVEIKLRNGKELVFNF